MSAGENGIAVQGVVGTGWSTSKRTGLASTAAPSEGKY